MIRGFRATIITLGLGFVVQFCFERLFRVRYVLPVALSAFSDLLSWCHLQGIFPPLYSCTLSILPVKIDPQVRASAQGSLEWRWEMWKALADQIPQYFWLGKGYAIDPTDLYFADQAMRRGFGKHHEGSLVAGDYHSGPLSILIPFGIFGSVGFVWFLGACIRLLYRNYRFGDATFKNINTFLVSHFVARVIFYFVGFGAMYVDLIFFCGVAGLSIAVNGGMKKDP